MSGSETNTAKPTRMTVYGFSTALAGSLVWFIGISIVRAGFFSEPITESAVFVGGLCRAIGVMLCVAGVVLCAFSVRLGPRGWAVAGIIIGFSPILSVA